MRKIIIFSALISILFISCATTSECKRKEIYKEENKEEKKEKKIIIEKPLEIIVDKKELNENSELKIDAQDFDSAQIFALANSYFDIAKYDEARNLYSRIIDKNPKFYLLNYCYFNLGLIYLKKNDFEKASEYFLSAYNSSEKNKDKIDSLILYLESLKKSEKWELLEKSAEEVLNKNPKNLLLSKDTQNEISLRMAEAIIMQGKLEEGRRLVNYFISEIRKYNSKDDLKFNPEYAMAQYILGMSVVYEFRNFPLDNSHESLVKKCTYILEAIKYFLTSIRTGVIYWTNASAYEIANMYTTLFAEMELFPIPENLSDEERAVYQCEVFNKISGLLKKAKKTIEGSIKAAKNINEQNEYTEKSFKMLSEIDEIYNKRVSFCENPLKKDDETTKQADYQK